MLRQHIGSICHVYLDDIVIWSQSLEEHRQNVTTILECLRKHSLFCSPKKNLFCLAINFLGHHISACGVKADNAKVEKILDWPVSHLAMEVCFFLGLVQYISNFLPSLAAHTTMLNILTAKGADKDFVWTPSHFAALEAIKSLVSSQECLTVINHNNLGDNIILCLVMLATFVLGWFLPMGLLWSHPSWLLLNCNNCLVQSSTTLLMKKNCLRLYVRCVNGELACLVYPSLF
ncbi:hypothetical protein PHLCEN_2v4071 [Hermanssonia centrifuga]|uniref:Reverse transcriptase domain-containing protein n=1 Tax=Hermanssonia centrifuga TaxID=98765 RepID=A0A2R6Q5F8_9APHY|nr:hypothetical protein PHLCEN_2v4071 [Hermanssonia centrifuga]